MKKIFCGIFCCLFYGGGIFLAGLYLSASLEERLILSPPARLLLLCGTALCIFMGGRILSLGVIPHKAEPVMKVTLWLVFLLYLILLLTFTLFDEYFGRTDFRFIFTAPDHVTGIYTKTSINLIPFKNIGNFTFKFFKGQLSPRFFLTNVGGNLLAFTPFALFLPLLTQRCKKFLPFTLATGICIVIIELAQILLLTGFCDVDDLILNLGGACIAYGLLHVPSAAALTGKVCGILYADKKSH